MPGHLRRLGGGNGPGLLLLLHGLGATADVWTPMAAELAAHWPGGWVALDLPGHGGSDPLPRYSFGALAASVAAEVVTDEPVVVVGHSLGGAVGLALASGWFGLHVTGVVGVGIKVAWSDEELAKAHALGSRPVTWFDTREEAAARHLLVAGLTGLVDPDDEAVTAAVQESGGRWRLRLDPPAFGVGAPDLPGLLAAARAPVVLARGETDPMVSTEQLERLVPDAFVLAGCGHNAHVERPALVAGLMARMVTADPATR